MIELRPSIYDKAIYTDRNGDSLNYRVYLPYRNTENLPLHIFLHGSGERGGDNEAQLTHIAPYLISDSIQRLHPCIIVAPQCPSDDTWSRVDREEGTWLASSNGEATQPTSLLLELIDKLIEEHSIDRDRVYITGLSMGGFGTLDILSRRPELFAGAASVCAGGDLSKAALYKDIPLRLYHGAEDPVVPVSLSRELYDKMKSLNAADVEYTEFPGVDHFAWDPAYYETDMLEWLYRQKK